MKFIAFLELAQWLLAHKKCPGGFRSAASRAYYSAFHCAIELLAEWSVVIPRGENKHERVPDLLDHTGDTEVQKAGTMLGNLREERNRADYTIDKPDYETEVFAKQRVEDARTIISKLSSCKLSKGGSAGRFEVAGKAAKKRADLLFKGLR